MLNTAIQGILMIKLQNKAPFKGNLFIFVAWLAQCNAPLIVRTIKFGNTKLDIEHMAVWAKSWQFGMVKLRPPTVEASGIRSFGTDIVVPLQKIFKSQNTYKWPSRRSWHAANRVFLCAPFHQCPVRQREKLIQVQDLQMRRIPKKNNLGIVRKIKPVTYTCFVSCILQ